MCGKGVRNGLKYWKTNYLFHCHLVIFGISQSYDFDVIVHAGEPLDVEWLLNFIKNRMESFWETWNFHWKVVERYDCIISRNISRILKRILNPVHWMWRPTQRWEFPKGATLCGKVQVLMFNSLWILGVAEMCILLVRYLELFSHVVKTT